MGRKPPPVRPVSGRDWKHRGQPRPSGPPIAPDNDSVATRFVIGVLVAVTAIAAGYFILGAGWLASPW
jgi:hypothetical protein